jgi:hypothetical protein
MSPTQANAYNYLLQLFDSYGLGTLAPRILQLVQQGLDENTVSLELQASPEYKQRFKANDARRKAGLAVLSPKEYLETERAYRQIMSSAGMPPGFYDQQDDFTKWLEGDVSPAEIKSRVDLAAQKANGMDDATKDTFWRFHGLAPTDLAAFFLDQDRALPQLEKISKAVDVGAAATRQGLNVSLDRAGQLANSQQAANADQLFGNVARDTREGEKLAQIYGDVYSQKDAEDEAFFGSEPAKRKKGELASKERAQFSGGSGVNQSSLSQAKSY